MRRSLSPRPPPSGRRRRSSSYLSPDEILSEARDLYGRWPQLEWDEKRRIIETAVEQITVDPDEIEIELAYIDSSQIMFTRETPLVAT